MSLSMSPEDWGQNVITAVRPLPMSVKINFKRYLIRALSDDSSSIIVVAVIVLEFGATKISTTYILLTTSIGCRSIALPAGSHEL